VELVVRFLLGGAVVSAFAAVGELFKRKTFSGLFGAAPSVAIASLALAFSSHSAAYVRTEARTMVVGAIAMFGYAVACVAVMQRKHFPVWLGAGIAWIAWFVIAFSVFTLARAGGLV
jgi:uncharacterized membrane protein (GlpM family)